jgi:hypothetical protein
MRLRETVRIAAVGVIILAKSKSCPNAWSLVASLTRTADERHFVSDWQMGALVGKWDRESQTKFMQRRPTAAPLKHARPLGPLVRNPSTKRVSRGIRP